MNKVIKYLIVYEIIILVLFGAGYFIYESKQPKETVFSCNIQTTDESEGIELGDLSKVNLSIEETFKRKG